MPSHILVYTEKQSTRASYILNHTLGSMLGLEVAITSDLDKAKGYSGAVISYSTQAVKGAIHIEPHPIVWEHGINNHSITLSVWKGIPSFFETGPDNDIPFDIFSAAFYLISRYEECLPYTPDSHGRFPANASIAHQYGFIETPVVDRWIKALGVLIARRYPGTMIRESKFCYIPTIDIDNAYAYLHKGFIRSTLSVLKSLTRFALGDIAMRVAVLLRVKPDPYDTYNHLLRILEQNPGAIWFILGGRLGPYDRHLPIGGKAMQRLIRSIGERFSVGIHPSYGSWGSRERVEQEVATLSAILGQPVGRSRHHFLRFRIPESYHTLADIGIKEEYSMGYSDTLGFRAGTCTPFPFYSLTAEKVLPLRVVPFQAMDVTLNRFLCLSPEQAIDRALKLAEEVAKVGGTFVTIWHNESLTGIAPWRGWELVLETIIKRINSLAE